MKYEMELTLVVKGGTDDESKTSFNVHSIDTVVANNLTKLLAQFMLVIATVHNRLLNDCKLENRIIDDDIPF